MRNRFVGLTIASLLLAVPMLSAESGHATLNWNPWSPELFAKAKAEKKLVLLDLEAVWCHWCHVMEEKTYSNPDVAKILTEKFILIRVDQDSRPDLSQRYSDWGWPATILFDGDGRELAKRAGFQPPEKLLALAKKLVKLPEPEEENEIEKPTVPQSPFLSQELRAKLKKGHLNQCDDKNGGWGQIHKFLFGPSEELALLEAWRGDPKSAKQARTTLTKALVLIDPVWGGAYQYSVHGWSEPHFEKIAWSQAKNLQLYSYAAALSQNAKFLAAANDVKKFLKGFLLSPEMAFFTSMDADLVKGNHSSEFFSLSDGERRKKGIPTIDRNLYARENGWYIQGLAALYSVTGSAEDLALGANAAEWILKNRSRIDGGFNHSEKDAAGPYLGDNQEMGAALLSLYEVTGDKKWLQYAEKAAQFIIKTFSVEIDSKAFGYRTAASALLPGQKPDWDRMENIRLARFGIRLFHYTGQELFKKMTEQALSYLVQPELAAAYPTAGTLLADDEVVRPPLHLTIVGGKKDPKALALFKSGLAYPSNYRRIEWWDKTEGPLRRNDVNYPEMGKAALFVCTEGRCSLPMTDPATIRSKIDDLLKIKSAAL